MIPILYEANETAFASNGLGRLRDTISARVVEERNGIYELDFDYPVSGAHYEDITLGRIVAVSHDDTGDIQPFDIVSYTKPLDGVVTFHCVHVSYRQSQLTTSGTNINSLSDAFTMLGNASPANPFNYQTDITSSAYMASADGTPRTVRQFLGGIEGSILDTYGGEYEWDRWNVILHKSRGTVRDWSIRYGVNLLNAQDDVDSQSTYTSCIPYWTGSDSDGASVIIKGNKVDSGLVSVDGRDRCVPLDLTDKFESQPTTAQLESEALAKMTAGQVNMPAQTLKVDFVRLQDMPEFADIGRLLACSLCDTITVILPTGQGQFKIVRTVWDVLLDKYEEMELGTLSTTLAEALGITQALDKMSDGIVMPDDYVTDIGTDAPWTYRKWNSGRIEAWRTGTVSVGSSTASGQLYRGDFTVSIPAGIFTDAPGFCIVSIRDTTSTVVSVQGSATSTTNINGRAYRTGTSSGYSVAVGIYVAQF